MKLGVTIGLFFGLSVVLLLLYLAVILIRHYLLVPRPEEPYREALDSESNIVELDISKLHMKENTARSKATSKDETDRSPVKNVLHGVFVSELVEPETIKSFEVPVWLAYHRGEQLKVLSGTLVSFVKQLKVVNGDQLAITFRKNIEEKEVSPGTHEYEEILGQLEGRPAVQRVMEFMPSQRYKIGVEYDIKELRAVKEQRRPVESLEEALQIEREHF